VHPENERRAPRGAALLGVEVRKQRTLFGDAIDVRRLIAHDAVVVGADVVDADVGFVLRRRGRGEQQQRSPHADRTVKADLPRSRGIPARENPLPVD